MDTVTVGLIFLPEKRSPCWLFNFNRANPVLSLLGASTGQSRLTFEERPCHFQSERPLHYGRCLIMLQ